MKPPASQIVACWFLLRIIRFLTSRVLSFACSFGCRCIVIQLITRQIALKISKRWVGRFRGKIERVREEIDVLDNQEFTKTIRNGTDDCAAFLWVSHWVFRYFTTHNNEDCEMKRLGTRGERTINSRWGNKGHGWSEQKWVKKWQMGGLGASTAF